MSKQLSKLTGISPKSLQDKMMWFVLDVMELGEELGYPSTLIIGEEHERRFRFCPKGTALKILALLKENKMIEKYEDKSLIGWVFDIEGLDYAELEKAYDELSSDFNVRTMQYFKTDDSEKLSYEKGLLRYRGKIMKLSGYQNSLCEIVFQNPKGIEGLRAEEYVYGDEKQSETDLISNLVKNINKKSKKIFDKRVLEYRNNIVKPLIEE